MTAPHMELMRAAVRQAPDVIVVGEVRHARVLRQVLALQDGEFKFRSRRPPQLEALARPTARLMHDVLNLGNHS